mgnify:CR=1 FL=1|tara:strand:+ start:1423 stop:1638 length:216 start_codon:yes stop_codon:yes gene_type:complete
MKTLILTIISSIFLIINLNATQSENCKNLTNKPIEYSKCIAEKGKQLGKRGLNKLNTDSKLTDWIKDKLNK